MSENIFTKDARDTGTADIDRLTVVDIRYSIKTEGHEKRFKEQKKNIPCLKPSFFGGIALKFEKLWKIFEEFFRKE